MCVFVWGRGGCFGCVVSSYSCVFFFFFFFICHGFLFLSCLPCVSGGFFFSDVLFLCSDVLFLFFCTAVSLHFLVCGQIVCDTKVERRLLR